MRLLATSGKLFSVDGRLLRSKDGLYNDWEIDYMIHSLGYIPVATPAEFDSMRLTGSRIMGDGSQWRGTYTTGGDKKYIQVKHIDFVGYTFAAGLAAQNGYVFDGNNLQAKNINYSFDALFNSVPNAAIIVRNWDVTIAHSPSTTSACISVVLYSGSIVENMRIKANVIHAIGRQWSGIICGTALAGAIIRNIIIDGYYQQQSNPAPGFGFVAGDNRGAVSNIWIKGSIYTLGGTTGLAFGQNFGSVENVHIIDGYLSSLPPSGDGALVGLFSGDCPSGSNITRCSAKGSLYQRADLTTRDSQIGGFIGRNNAVISNSFAHVNVDTNTRYIGGIVGFNQSGGNISNSYSVGQVLASGIYGGISGWNSGVISNSYYDKDVTGFTLGAGLARTTAQMKAGTASSFILSDGTTDPNNLAANAMYTGWSNDIWNFGDNTKYPILK